MVLVSGKTKQKTASNLPVWQIHGCIRSAYGIRKGITSLCKGNYCRLRICIHEITVSVYGCKLVSSSPYSGPVMAVIGQVSSSGSFFHEGCRYHTCHGSQPQTGFVFSWFKGRLCPSGPVGKKLSDVPRSQKTCDHRRGETSVLCFSAMGKISSVAASIL